MKIETLFQKILYRCGFRLNKVQSPELFHARLKKHPLEVIEYELNNRSAFIRTMNDIAYYDGLLKQFNPSWNIEIKESEFIGHGIGGSSLNVFRKVKTEKEIYFEKVYFSSKDDFYRASWFHDTIYATIENIGVSIPQIQRVYTSDILTVAYFDYLEVQDLEKDTSEGQVVDISLKLYTASLTNEIAKVLVDAPDTIKNYKSHFEYKRNVSKANARLLKHNIIAKDIEETITASKLILTHGDLHNTNVFKGSIVIDWDSFGVYPLGLEPAFIYFRLLEPKERNADFQAWLDTNYKNMILQEDWSDFERNFFYFLYLFSYSLFKNNRYAEMEKKLIKKLSNN